MNSRQKTFIKNIEERSPKEIAQFVYDGNITWEELVHNTYGTFSLGMQRRTLAELEMLKNPIPTIQVKEEKDYDINDNNQAVENNSQSESVIKDDSQRQTVVDNYSNQIQSEEQKELNSSVVKGKQNYGVFSHKGRMSRLPWFGINIGLNIIVELLSSASVYSGGMLVLFFILLIPIIWIQVCVNAKRCHDIGWSGWFQLIPFIGIVLLFKAGQKEDNEYGPTQQ